MTALALPTTTPDLDAWSRQVLSRSSVATGWLVSLLCPGEGGRAFRLVYAAFRVLDDLVDAPGGPPAGLAVGVEDLGGAPGRALAEVLDGPLGPRLEPAIRGMWAAQRVDLARRGQVLSAAALDAQRARIGDAYLLALWVCSGAPGEPPAAVRALARAATGAHWLRDLEEDRALGYCNVPAEVLAAHGLGPTEARRDTLGAWLAPRRAELRAELATGRSAVRGPWRTRVLLTLLAWRYRSQLA